MADVPKMNAPASGSYGERQAEQDLKSALPSSSGPAPQAAPPVPPTATDQPPTIGPRAKVGRPVGSPPPPGVPAALLAQGPTSSPFGGQSAAPPQGPWGASDNPAPYLNVLDMLINNPNVTSDTREWAERTKKYILEAAD